MACRVTEGANLRRKIDMLMNRNRWSRSPRAPDVGGHSTGVNLVCSTTVTDPPPSVVALSSSPNFYSACASNTLHLPT